MKVADLQRYVKYPIESSQKKRDATLRSLETPKEKTAAGSFSEILTEKMTGNSEIRFSAHAIRRIEQRHIVLSGEILARLEEGIQKVSEKGAKSALILIDDIAYIVSVKNNMVVTAMDRIATENNVFTNIDSVAIV